MARGTHVIQAIRAEYLRHRELAEQAVAQLDPAQLAAQPPGHGLLGALDTA